MVAAPQRWIYRRTETVTYADSAVIDRRVTADVLVPQMLPGTPLPDGRTPRMVPIAILEKRPLIGFDLRDETGERLPMVTSEQNAIMAAAVARAWIGAHDQDALRLLADAELDAIVGRDSVTAHTALHGLATRVPGVVDGPWWPLLQILADHFILFVPDEDVPARRLITFSYQEHLASTTAATAALTAPLRVGGAKTLRVLTQWLGWTPTVTIVAVTAAGHSRSHHVEVLAPPALEFSGATLVIEADEQRREVTAVGSARIAHLHIAAHTPTDAYGEAEIGLQSPRKGWLTSALVSAAVVFATLLAGRVALERIVTDDGAAANASLLVAVTGVVAGLLSRPGEHALVSKVLAGRRLVLGLTGLAAFAAAASLTLGLKAEQLVRLWTVCTFTAGLTVFVLVVSYVRASPLRRAESAPQHG
jgi:hypothetical protein